MPTTTSFEFVTDIESSQAPTVAPVEVGTPTTGSHAVNQDWFTSSGIPLKNNLAATTDPVATDDGPDGGYGVGSIWINTTASPARIFQVTDITDDAAVWKQICNLSDAQSFVSLIDFDAGTQLKQITTPSTPSAGDMKFYPKSGSQFYQLNSAGLEKQIGDVTTTNGDIPYRASGVLNRLGIGTAGQILQVSGGVPAWAANPGVTPTYTAETDNYTILTTDQNIEIDAATNKTFTLPTAIGSDGLSFRLFAKGVGTHDIATTSSQTIDGLASGVIKLNDTESITVTSDGANWVTSSFVRRSLFTESFGTTQTSYTTSTFTTLEGMTLSHYHPGGILMIGFHCVWQTTTNSNGIRHRFRVGGTVIDPSSTEVKFDQNDTSIHTQTYIGGHDVAEGTYTVDCQVRVVTAGTYAAQDSHRKLMVWSLGH